MSRHDAMRKIYEADPEAHEWRCRMPEDAWGAWDTSSLVRPSWAEYIDYEIRRRDRQPVEIPSHRDGMPNALHPVGNSLRYRHIKSGKQYDYLMAAVMEPTGEIVVVYKGDAGAARVRPLNKFLKQFKREMPE